MSDIMIREATADDVPVIVAMLADDPLGSQREMPGDPEPYLRAFAKIDADPNQFLAVAERDGVVIGTLQLTFIRGLSRRGATRAQIESVRVAASERGAGLGAELMTWAIGEARARGCYLVQLTSDKTREGAHRFYDRLGFKGTHVGYKLML